MRQAFSAKFTLLLAAGCFGLAVAAPAPAAASDKEFFGTGLGAALGGLLGSQFGRGEGQLATTAAGVFFGGLVGQDVGQSLDRADRLYTRGHRQGDYGYYAPRRQVYYDYYEPTYVAPPAPPPQRVIYVQQPVVQYRHAQHYNDHYDRTAYRQGSYCREYTQRVRIGDRIEESYGTACLQPDGAWQVQR